MKVHGLELRTGTRVTSVDGIGHKTDGVAYWYFLCTLEYDGTTKENYETIPSQLCYTNDDGKETIHSLMEKMNAYLCSRGKWLKKGKWVGDYLVYWEPKKPTGLVAL